MTIIQPWLAAILANPITKQRCQAESFNQVRGVIDARVFLKNTHGYSDWAEGQQFYEEELSGKDRTTAEAYWSEINYDRPIYEHYLMKGRILDCGGGAGSVREFLADDVEFVLTDPWLQAPFASSATRKEVYSCLSCPLNFIGATAEFQPFIADSFDWVHMRSMLDHVQVVDLTLLEARRVLKPGGRILIGHYVDGGKSGVIPFERRIKDVIKVGLEFFGVDRWKDHHIWHPTYKNLLKLISDNGFAIEDTYWQPQCPAMTRFMMTLKDAVELVLYAFEHGSNGDIFVQKAPAATVKVLAQAILELMGRPKHEVRCIGTRHGEKLYETLLGHEEMACAEDMGDYFRIPPDARDLNYAKFIEQGDQRNTASSHSEDYNSHNTNRLDVADMKALLLKLDFMQRIVREHPLAAE